MKVNDKNLLVDLLNETSITIGEDNTIATLGPKGTCSEKAALYYMQSQKMNGQVALYPTFEEGVIAIKEGKAMCVIIPSAYRELNEIIFEERMNVEIVDVFKLDTDELVVANIGDVHEIKKVASHASPLRLAQEYFKNNVEIILSNSNSDSVNMLLAGKVDACITTLECVKFHKLNILFNFGAVSMGWNVIKRKDNKKYKERL